MIPDVVENARYGTILADSPVGLEVPVLFVDIDGVEYIFESEQKLLHYGAATFAGWTVEVDTLAERYEVVLEIQGKLRRFQGATNDPRIVELVRRFVHNITNNLFIPGTKLPIE